MTWPVGQGKSFGGIMNLRTKGMTVFESGSERLPQDFETVPLSDRESLRGRFGHEFETAEQSMELAIGASPSWDHAAFLAGRQTPVFFGSAINNFGVHEILDALADLAPPPGPRAAIQREVLPSQGKFSGVVFKIQANMDPAHRDRIAFVRVCSGQFERGMRLTVVRNDKVIRPGSVVSFLSQRRELLEFAFPGDIIGIPNHGTLQLGDTLTEGESLQFTGLPFFAPEIFQQVEIADPMKSKQLKLGLAQLGEEGAIQVFRPHHGGSLLLGAVGQLQFEVVAHRLQHEYGVPARMAPSRSAPTRRTRPAAATAARRTAARRPRPGWCASPAPAGTPAPRPPRRDHAAHG
jgi:peptide chain release factor 3